MRACDVFPAEPQSNVTGLYLYDWTTVKEGALVYVQGSAMRAFVNCAFARIPSYCALVTEDRDYSMPPVNRNQTQSTESLMMLYSAQPGQATIVIALGRP